MLDRKIDSIDTKYGKVKIKSAFYNKRLIKSKPEYEDCIKIAKENNLPISVVYKLIEKTINENNERTKK